MLRTCRAEQRLRLETRTHTKCLLPMKFQDSTIRLVYNGVQKNRSKEVAYIACVYKVESGPTGPIHIQFALELLHSTKHA
jgi:hypothetical protein